MNQAMRLFASSTVTRIRVCRSTRLVLWSVATASTACFVDAAETVDFNRDVKPILADHCFACHGMDANTRKADLRLDVRDAAVEFGALVPGKSAESSLIERLFEADPELIMPPPHTKKPLSDEQKELLKRWVDAGAEYQAHWAFNAPTKPAKPDVAANDWVKNPIDTFVLAKLQENGLAPNPPADERTLFRRVHFDITGLPPSPTDVEAFVDDYSASGDTALSDWIDRLMAKPTWGEHRARYWLDAARYADTHGLHFDNYREIWLYRDWVIRAFNRNQPFDEFVIEQLAGDLLENPTTDQLIATGFQRCNITTNEGGTIAEENLANYAADRVQTFGWVFLGLTTNCSQCHDHKFDPLTMKDYYSLAAFFRNTTQGPLDGNTADGRGPSIRVPSEEDLPRWEALPDEIAAAKQARDERKQSAQPDFQQWLTTLDPVQIRERVPSEGLALQMPLVATVAAVEGEAAPAEQPEVAADGPLGPAPIVREGKTASEESNGSFEANEAFSYGVWVKPDSTNGSAAVIAKMDVNNNYRGWDLWREGASYGAHLIDQWQDNALKVVIQQNVVTPGKWQHVFITYDGSGKPGGVKVFVDGKEQKTRVAAQSLKAGASFKTDTPLRVGQRSAGALLNGGAVQDLRLYSKQLSDAEVKTIYDSTALLTAAETVADKRTPEQNTILSDFYLNNVDAQYPQLLANVDKLEGEYKAIENRSPITHVQQEKANSTAMANILMRGQYDKPGDEVTANTPAALHPMQADARRDRLGLAEWVVDSANPLTARVTVNRFWQELFGQGLVATPEDFGVMGIPPVNQDLLDWFTLDFQANGWDVKRLYKQMLMSATYRQAATVTPEKLEKDRDNSLLSRGPRYRMDAEMVRDMALSTSGLLSDKMYGPGTKPYQPEGIWDVVGLPGGDTRNYVQDKGENLYRRTVYTFWKRMAPPPNLETLNAPSREFCVVKRERTNTPLQALVTLNDPQFFEAARVLAQNAIAASAAEGTTVSTEGRGREVENGATVSTEGRGRAGGDETTARMQFMAERLIARPLSERELQIANASLSDYRTYYESAPQDAELLIHYGDSEPTDSVGPVELASWTMLANQLMNLDETLNK